MSVMTLRSGDAIPRDEPKRYLSDRGYVRLRWLVGPEQYVEAYEHRVVMGLPAADLDVHHRNGVKTDNRPANLVCLSKVEHAKLHATTTPQQYKGKPRQALGDYPRCTVDECGRPAQCEDRSLCLMHYKRWKRHGSTEIPKARRAA